MSATMRYASMPYTRNFPAVRNFVSEIKELPGCEAKEEQMAALTARQNRLAPHSASPSDTSPQAWRWPDGPEQAGWAPVEGQAGHQMLMTGQMRSSLSDHRSQKKGVLEKVMWKESEAANLVRGGQQPPTPSLHSQMRALDAERDTERRKRLSKLSNHSIGEMPGDAQCSSATLDVYPPIRGQYDSPGVGLPDRAQPASRDPVEIQRMSQRYSRCISVRPNEHSVGLHNQEERVNTMRGRQASMALGPRKEHVPTPPVPVDPEYPNCVFPHQIVEPSFPKSTAPTGVFNDMNRSFPQIRPTKQPFTPPNPKSTVWTQMQRARIMAGVY